MMRKTLILYAGVAMLLQIIAAWLVYQMSHAWLDMFILGHLSGFALRSPAVHWLIRLSRFSVGIPVAFILAAVFLIGRRRSEKALLHMVVAGLATPLAIVALACSMFLTQLRSGTWQPRIEDQQDVSQQPSPRDSSNAAAGLTGTRDS